jgi:hypothetical protein
MPQENKPNVATNAVIGDGVVTIPPIDKEKKMPGFDLPDGMAQMMATETAANLQSTNNNSREVFRQSAGVLAAVITRIPTEPSVLGSRAVSGVLATPIASPTVQQGGPG